MHKVAEGYALLLCTSLGGYCGTLEIIAVLRRGRGLHAVVVGVIAVGIVGVVYVAAVVAFVVVFVVVIVLIVVIAVIVGCRAESRPSGDIYFRALGIVCV